MTYEYACEACGHHWEAEQSIKDAALKTCVSCGKNKAKRLISGGTGFLLKGGGWYADGYGGKPAASLSSADATASKGASEAAGGGSASDTKSEGKGKSEAQSSSTQSSSTSESSPAKSADASPKPASSSSTPSAKAS